VKQVIETEAARITGVYTVGVPVTDQDGNGLERVKGLGLGRREHPRPGVPFRG
jgi:hypothetical protein